MLYIFIKVSRALDLSMQDRGAFDLQGFWPHTLLILREVSLLIDILEFILDCFHSIGQASRMSTVGVRFIS